MDALCELTNKVIQRPGAIKEFFPCFFSLLLLSRNYVKQKIKLCEFIHFVKSPKFLQETLI